MKITEVEKPEVTKFDSEGCPDHWNNVIIFGKCWRHTPEAKKKEAERKKKLDAMWKTV